MKKIRKIMILAILLGAVLALKPPATAYAFNVTPIEVMELYSTSATPVYAAPDLFTPVVTYLDRFTNVRVNGITDNGFFRLI